MCTPQNRLNAGYSTRTKWQAKIHVCPISTRCRWSGIRYSLHVSKWLCQPLAVHDSRVLTETLQGLETSETLMYEFVCSFPVRISPPFVVTACPDPMKSSPDFTSPRLQLHQAQSCRILLYTSRADAKRGAIFLQIRVTYISCPNACSLTGSPDFTLAGSCRALITVSRST